ncbi:hypothetical protein CEUSTIGMA_g9741.t1 [Chlamydomonas eustigma]|uniref:Peptidase M41 domain-containing protein n=1 Tax=Chlamydomonas eustigma TaxID=1157962 RepID=A0A250XHB3_9CHLO|nr:hypothetical protein CEUSTIGMA_g9741.t1 [Chlamydomonas eustigma]|eukprot:GAX82312.1 hypothetical protein CEUSTIGMA_g9741.t1 [Chlamydomonas eustigma]
MQMLRVNVQDSVSYRRSCLTRHGFKRSFIVHSASKEVYSILDDLLARVDDPTSEVRAVDVALQTRAAGDLIGFGSYAQRPAVPKRIYTIEELRLNGIQAELLLSPRDTSLTFVRNAMQVSALLGLGVLTLHGDVGQVLSTAFGVIFALVFDQVANQGGGEALLVDSVGRLLLPSYRSRVALHEAGHFLIAYFVGVLPKTYTLTSLDAFLRFRKLNLQAGTQFCDKEFTDEIQSGKLSSSSLDRYTCVALAGVVTEYLRFGQAEGGIGDVLQLDGMFRALGFSQMKADGEVRWAVLNVAAILRKYRVLQERIAEAMELGKPVGSMIEMIDEHVADELIGV